MFLNCSTCFGPYTAHHQELQNCNCSLWFYIRLWLSVAAMAEPSQRPTTIVWRPKHVEQLRNIGIINSATRSHLVGSFCEIYITMHGSMNIKCLKYFPREPHIGLAWYRRCLRTYAYKDFNFVKSATDISYLICVKNWNIIAISVTKSSVFITPTV